MSHAAIMWFYPRSAHAQRKARQAIGVEPAQTTNSIDVILSFDGET